MKRFLSLILLVLAAIPASAAELPWLTRALAKFFDSSNVLVAGWSKDGKAVVIAPVDGGGRGGPAARVVLWEAVEDKLLAEVELWPDEFEDARNTSSSLAQAMAESEQVRDFLETCTDSKIQPLFAPEELLEFPFPFNGEPYNARAVVTPRSGKDEFGARAVAYRVVVSQPKGDKTVTSGSLAHTFEVGVAGAFVSPWEPRMLVVYWHDEPGFEGERPTTYGFAGSHLLAGYKKP